MYVIYVLEAHTMNLPSLFFFVFVAVVFFLQYPSHSTVSNTMYDIKLRMIPIAFISYRLRKYEGSVHLI